MKRRTSLSQKLIFYYLTIFIAAIFFLSSYSYYTARNALIDRTFQQLTSVRFEKTNNIERFLSERLSELKSISRIPEIFSLLPCSKKKNCKQTQDTSEFSKFVQRFIYPKKDYYRSIMLTDTSGKIFGWQFNENPDKEGFFSTTFQQLNKQDLLNRLLNTNNLIFENCQADSHNYLPLISIANPIFSDTLKGFVVLEIRSEMINSIMFNTNPLNGLGNTGEAYIVGADYLMRTSSRFKTNSIMKTVVNTTGVNRALNGESGSDEYIDYRGKKVLGSYGKISLSGLNWVMLAEIDTDEAMIPVYTLRNSVILLTIIVSVLVFGFVFLISKKISLPIAKLKHGLLQVSKGESPGQLPVTQSDEIGELTASFNWMSEMLKKQSEELKKERSSRIRSVMDAQEAERQRIARELHDGLGQYILAVKLKLERAADAEPELRSKIIEEAKSLLSETAREIRSMSDNLVPPVLSEFGLVNALENLFEIIRNSTQLKVVFEKDISTERCDDKTKIYLYRIVQEATNNVIKHSGAKYLFVRLKISQKYIFLTISDDGIGFNPKNITKKGNGLVNMKDRAEILEGTMTISSEINKGTEINFIIPYNNE